MASRSTKIFGLADFGLSVAGLEQLGHRSTEIVIQQKAPPWRSLIPLDPSAREAKLTASLARGLKKIEKLCPVDALLVRGDGPAWTLDATTSAKTALEVSALPNVAHVQVEWIQGVRPRTVPKPLPQWFAVWGEVAVQIEGRVQGNQTLEDRILLVRATSEENAKRRLVREWEAYAKPYLNPDFLFVRWKLERILDVYTLPDDEIYESGTEVFSRFRKRRMRPEHEWHPGYSDGKPT